MKALAGSARFLGRLSLLALAFAAAILALAQDSPRVAADHSETIIVSTAASGSHLNNIFIVLGGSPRTLYVRAKDVTHDDSGVAGFQVHVEFDPNVAAVTSIVPDPVWLGSTGRSVTCSDPDDPQSPGIRPIIPGDPDGLWEAIVFCSTLGATPLGPQGSGLLATLTLEPGSEFGAAGLLNRSLLFNTTEAVGEELIIPVTVRSSSLTVARCGDFHIPPNGSVTVADMGFLVAHFGTAQGLPNWDAIYDLSENGSVTVADMGLIVVQFGTVCSQ